MKGKTILSLAIVLSMTLAVMPLVAVKAVPTATMEIVFENGLHSITKNVCNNFVVTLVIKNAPPVTQWIVEITWDPAVLELVHAPPSKVDIHQGNFLSSVGSTVFLIKTPELGRIPEITCATLGLETNSGNGTLATIDFHAKAPGDSPITLVRHLLLNGMTPVPCDKVDGQVHVPTPPPTRPNAEFEPEDGTLITVCTDVVLDGSASTPGYDTLPPPGETCPITEYKWEIDIGNDGTIEYTKYGVTSWFKPELPALLFQVGITLTVIAPDPSPPTDPRYVDHDSEKHMILVQWPCGWPWAFDVYTERGGRGGPLGPYPIGWSDAFGPQEEITIYALITHYKEPVEYKPVAFEIKDPNGTTRDYRTAFTNASGIANTTFRIPWEGSGAEALFGDWSIIGIVDVAEIILSDICKFRFGYIVSIRNILMSGLLFKKGQNLGVAVDIKNIAYTSKSVFVTIVLHDECNVPIGLQTIDFTVDHDDGVTSMSTLTIPDWAFVGSGKVYINIYNKPPASGGTPMCPEGTAIFIIQKTADL